MKHHMGQSNKSERGREEGKDPEIAHFTHLRWFAAAKGLCASRTFSASLFANPSCREKDNGRCVIADLMRDP